MKTKFIIFLILIILIGGTGFYFGWIQFQLEENTYGVIFTKTGGYDEGIVSPGTFIWRWEALIPTNFTLHSFEITPRSKAFLKKGILPSGDIYGTVLDSPVQFDYALDLKIQYTLIPDKLPLLVAENGVTPENISEWYDQLELQLSNAVTSLIEERIAAFDSPSDQFLLSPVNSYLQEELNEKFDYIQIIDVSILELQFPDIALYSTARDYYLSLLLTRRDAEEETLKKERSWMVSEESKLEVLKKYGEVFTEYPGLIQFLALRDQQDLQDLLPSIEIIRETVLPEAMENE